MTCNITAYFTWDSAWSEFFGSLATETLTLEKSNALVPSVIIDNKKTTKYTDSLGIASFNFKILKGLDSTLTSVFCESNSVRSPLSTPIKIQNKIAEVRLENKFGGKFKVDFMTDKLGNIIETTFIIGHINVTLLDNRGDPVLDVKFSEIDLILIS